MVMIQPSMLRTATAPVEVRGSDLEEFWVGALEVGGGEVRGGSMSISVVVVAIVVCWVCVCGVESIGLEGAVLRLRLRSEVWKLPIS